MMKLKKNDIVEVEWLDVLTDPDWQSESSASHAQLPRCRSVGYFLNRKNGVYRISQSMFDDERDVMVIPTTLVQKIRKL